MSLVGSITRCFRPALILYVAKSVAAIIVALPVMSFLNGSFGLSRLADGFWPFPNHITLVELFWQIRDMVYIILPLIFITGLFYFLSLQFLYGGICDYALNGNRFSRGDFFKAGSQYFGGFLKIALAAIPVYIVVFLVADLIGLAFGKLADLIAGSAAGSVVTILVVFIFMYCLSGYLINLRFVQIKNDNSSLRFAVKFTRRVMAGRLRHFLALNMIAGFMSVIVMAIPLLILISLGRLEFSTFSLIAIVLVQQIMIFLGSFFEAFQININRRIIKESDYGT